MADTAPATETTSSSTQTPDAPYDLSADKMMKDNLLILALLFFIFYFILIRPQQKRVKMHNEMMKGLTKGNKVLTGGGIIGVITGFEGDDIVVVEISQGVKVRVARSSISEVVDNAAAGKGANDN